MIIGFGAILAAKTAMCQDYKAFRIGLGTGLAAPQHYFPGFLLYVEPSLRLNKYSIGLRLETVGRPDADIGILGSYTVNGQYYFTEGSTGFFGGLGFGVYTTNSALLGSCTCEDQLKNTVWGLYPRLGFERKHMVITLDVNLVQKATQKVQYDVPVTNPEPSYYQASTSHATLKIGWLIGAGRKKEHSTSGE